MYQNIIKLQNQNVFLTFSQPYNVSSGPFGQTEVTHFPTLSHTSTSENSALSYAWTELARKKYPYIYKHKSAILSDY